MKMVLFLRWALFATLMLVGAIIAVNIEISDGLNFFQYIYARDMTKLSFVIMAIFIAMSVRCGVLTWRASNDIEIHDDYNAEIKDIENKADHGWFARDLCVDIGLLGTVLGLIYMLVSGFGNFQTADAETIMELLQHIIAGMSMAFITTFVGISSRILLGVQYQNLSNAIDRQKSYYEQAQRDI